MKTPSLVVRIFILAVVCSMILVGATIAIARTCYTMHSEYCVEATACTTSCSPSCGSTYKKIPWSIDKCEYNTSGYYSCYKSGSKFTNCYRQYECEDDTETECPTDPSEKQCKSKNDYATYTTGMREFFPIDQICVE